MENVVDDKTHFLLKANKYKKFARWIGDGETVQRVLALAEELKQRARARDDRGHPGTRYALGRPRPFRTAGAAAGFGGRLFARHARGAPAIITAVPQLGQGQQKAFRLVGGHTAA